MNCRQAGPSGLEDPGDVVDAHVGGTWQLVRAGPGGAEFPLGGTYRAVDPPHRLVFTTGDPTTRRVDGGTLMRFRHTGVLTEDEHAEQARDGWVMLFSQPADC